MAAPAIPIPTRLTVPVWNEHFIRTGQWLHVYVNGQDVTPRCLFADSEEGEAQVFKQHHGGGKTIDPATGKIALETLRGRVQIVPGDPFTGKA